MRLKGITASVCFGIQFCAAAIGQNKSAGASAVATHSAVAMPSRCDEAPYHLLDFWLGKWDVFDSSDGSKAGSSILENVLNGCVIEVNWVGVGGDKVKEIFYYAKAKKQWNQLWLGDTGRTKQRQLVEQLKDGGVRFQGEVEQFDGGTHLDRSTVIPLPGHRIHQVIETSSDAGKTWHVGFDAEYRKQK